MTPEADDVEVWLDAYGRAWERRDVPEFARLFTPDATYQWTPFEEPKRGRTGIAEAISEAVARQRDIRFGSEVLAVTSIGALAHWTCSFERIQTGRRVRLDGVFLMEFASDGRCSRFREWWHSDELSD